MQKKLFLILCGITLFAWPQTVLAKSKLAREKNPKACFGEYKCERWYRLNKIEEPDACNYETPCGRWYDENNPPKREIILRGINFDFDKYSIRKDSYPILEKNLKTLKDSKSLKIHIIGHTDWIGSNEYNDELSIKRAKSVRNYLSDHGINPKRMTIEGRGERQPAASNSSSEGRFMNRRIVIQY